MKKSRFNEEQIVRILQQQEAGAKVSEIIREHGISEQTFYNWKAKYGGMTVSEIQRLKVL
ncbi:MAG: transposase, partial [Acidobacteriota bacterium]